MISEVMRHDRAEDIEMVEPVGWLYVTSDSVRYYQAIGHQEIFEVDDGDVAVVAAMQRATPRTLEVYKDHRGKIIRRMVPFWVPTSIEIDPCFSRIWSAKNPPR
jgi:hypothetical protein